MWNGPVTLARTAALIAALALPACSGGSGGAVGNSTVDDEKAAAAAPAAQEAQVSEDITGEVPAEPENVEVATFGAGCFWCTEAVLEQVDGVLDVRSGYMGGYTGDPTYEEVCGGDTGHAEVVQVRFDPSKITYQELLDWFWKLHDPTTYNRQGPDVGTQYRSMIFTHSAEQRRLADDALDAAQERFGGNVVTQVERAGAFYPAEGYHQDYFRRHPDQDYCRIIIAPKLEKLGLDKTPSAD